MENRSTVFNLNDAVKRGAIKELAGEIRRLRREIDDARRRSSHTCDEYDGCGKCELEELALGNGTY